MKKNVIKKSKERYSNDERIKIYITIDDTPKYPIRNHLYSSYTPMYTSREIMLANEIAETLHDTDALPLYLTYTRTYPEELLRSILAKVLAIPKEKIKKTRGALFTYLVGQHAHKNSRSWD